MVVGRALEVRSNRKTENDFDNRILPDSQKVGCDWTVDSDATEDRCGICHGDGTQCETTSGFYNKSEGLGYKEVVVIPAGSRNIKIEETSQSTNYIGIGVPNSDKYFLNGKRCVRVRRESFRTARDNTSAAGREIQT